MRHDAWTTHEDSILLDTVLEYVRRGMNVTDAFEDVGLQLGRTKGAVTYRFNSKLIKEYRDIYDDAKRGRVTLRNRLANSGCRRVVVTKLDYTQQSEYPDEIISLPYIEAVKLKEQLQKAEILAQSLSRELDRYINTIRSTR